MGLLKFLFIGFCIFWLLGRIGRFLLSVILPGYIKKKANQYSQGQPRQEKRPSDGNVNIDYMPGESQKTKTNKGGDFVDYEEVK
ncbi:MAG: DUF4834 family protein [Cyclobacteriaceae bacterium]|nr:DUF4834 family protein [Cyclobacteriaceae bacterium]